MNTPSTVTATDLASFTWRDGESKLIRSLMTGSDITKNCQSRFGIQDHVGNLSEWSTDSFLVTTVSTTNSDQLLSLNNIIHANDFYNLLTKNILDDPSYLSELLSIGIGVHDEVGLLEDRNFVIDSATDIVESLNIPMGLPIRPNAITDLESVFNKFTDFIFPIGNTSGVETDHLHNDRHYFWDDDNTNGNSGDDLLFLLTHLEQTYFLVVAFVMVVVPAFIFFNWKTQLM